MKLLGDLRGLVPARRVSRQEAYVLTERQATRLLVRSGISCAPVPTEVISELPFIQLEQRPLKSASGSTKWIKPRWVVVLNSLEPSARRRFSLAHEFKHVLDHPYLHQAYGALDTATTRLANEQLCDYFAACLLMPRMWVKAAWGSGLQDTVALARHFDVSPRAMHVRLLQLGLVDPYVRHGGENHNDQLYLRSLPVSLPEQAA